MESEPHEVLIGSAKVLEMWQAEKTNFHSNIEEQLLEDSPGNRNEGCNLPGSSAMKIYVSDVCNIILLDMKF